MTKEELEKEAEEIYQKTDREFMDCQDEGEIFTLAYLAGAEPREKRISELEYQLTHRNCLDCSNHSSKLRMRTLELEKECTKAKKLLKKVVTDFHNMDCVTVHIDKMIAEAEQFLKEVENKE